jgi:threonine synthase
MNSASRGRSFVSHLECSQTQERFTHDRLHGLSNTGQPLFVRYDLDAVRGAVSKKDLLKREPNLWRYTELLPMSKNDELVDLGEAVTPLVRLNRLEKQLGARRIDIKDEGRMPTGSFKARGMAVAVTMAKAFGITCLAVPTAGNAGSAAAAYGSRASMETYVFTPDDTPDVTLREIGYHGARVYKVNGLINQCAGIVRAGTQTMGWHNLSTLEEPYRIEGKKTMGLELAEQLGWSLPDIIYYPTGGGTGYIGMWKAFDELEAIGWIGSKRPRMIPVQSTGCGPIVKAYETGQKSVTEAWENVDTQVHGVRVPKPLGGALILDVLYQSSGFAVAVSDEDADDARTELAREEGLHLCPEGALCYAAYKQNLAAGTVKPEEHVVIFNTANGLKSPMPPVEQKLDCTQPVDYQNL